MCLHHYTQQLILKDTCHNTIDTNTATNSSSLSYGNKHRHEVEQQYFEWCDCEVEECYSVPRYLEFIHHNYLYWYKTSQTLCSANTTHKNGEQDGRSRSLKNKANKFGWHYGWHCVTKCETCCQTRWLTRLALPVTADNIHQMTLSFRCNKRIGRKMVFNHICIDYKASQTGRRAADRYNVETLPT